MARKKKKSVEYNNPNNYHPIKQLKPKTVNQASYIRSVVESDVVFCSGPAGSGKTAVAVGLACEHLLTGKVEKIVIARPTVESGRGLGYLPGTFTAKIQPYLVPVMEEISKYVPKELFHSFRGDHTIEMCPLEYMRGRNFHNSFMILDETQNATLEQIKMFITRIGRGSTAVLNGDPDQTDLEGRLQGGFQFCMDKLEGLDGISICKLDGTDIIRNDIIATILGKLNS